MTGGLLVAPPPIREIGPILIALMFSGRVGANNTAELSTMTVTEQLDGLKVLADLGVTFQLVDGAAARRIEPALHAQFHPLEDALEAMGVVVWPMVELEADDALASAAQLSRIDADVEKVCIWTPDKDLAQCVEGDRVVQIDRRTKAIRNAAAVRDKFGVEPALIPDYLALVGDAADGYPGIAGIGPKTAAALLNRHGTIERFPSSVLGEQRPLALLFKQLATLRSDAPLFDDVDQLRWTGPAASFEAWSDRMQRPRLLQRARSLAVELS